MRGLGWVGGVGVVVGVWRGVLVGFLQINSQIAPLAQFELQLKLFFDRLTFFRLVYTKIFFVLKNYYNQARYSLDETNQDGLE